MQISAFRNFDVNQEVEFPKTQVTSIVGQNKDSGGSNGTGKSSLAIATKVNLFGPKSSSLSSKNLENRYINGKAHLVGFYDLDGKELIVDRTIGGKLTFSYDNKTIDGKVEDVQDRLNELLKINSEQFTILSSKEQGEYGGFLLMKDSEKKDFLSSFFDVTHIEEAKKKADEESKFKEGQIAVISGKIEYGKTIVTKLNEKVTATQKKLDESQETLKEIQALTEVRAILATELDTIKEMLEEEAFAVYVNTLDTVKEAKLKAEQKVAELKAQVLTLTENKAAATKRLTEVNELSKPTDIPEELTTKRAQADAILLELSSRQKKSSALNTDLALLDAKQARLRTDLTSIQSASCTACGAPLKEDVKAAKISKISSEIATLDNQRVLIEAAAKEVAVTDDHHNKAAELKKAAEDAIADFKLAHNQDSLKREARTLTDSLSSMSSGINNLNSLISLEERSPQLAIDQVRLTLRSKASDLNNRILMHDNAISSKLNVIESIKKDLVDSTNNLEAMTKEFEVLEKQKSEMSQELEILNHVSKIASKSGFIGYIFDSILEDLNMEINENLKMIPVASNFSLQFSSDKVSKQGAVSKAITYQLLSGEEAIEFDSLSGGEKLSVILAVDEALDSTMSRRLGITVGWKFLDEQFYWIDENSKEAILDFYRLKSADRAYFIVDHASEFNAAFDSKITIIKENNLARFT